jgi:DnaJ homologue, subfamily C, member 28, conserved domain
MLAFELLAERRIEEALARGELDDLPGRGAPLALDDDPLVPEELRLAHRILKNAGLVPPEVIARREIAELERLVLDDGAPDAAARARAARKLALLRTRIERGYYERVLARIGR